MACPAVLRDKPNWGLWGLWCARTQGPGYRRWKGSRTLLGSQIAPALSVGSWGGLGIPVAPLPGRLQGRAEAARSGDRNSPCLRKGALEPACFSVYPGS